MVIGLLDSGIGGLDLLSKLIKRRVATRYVYLADNLFAPYGSKSREELIKIIKNRVNKLIYCGADIIVLACNTATVAAIKELRGCCKLPIFGVTPPVYKALNHRGNTLVVGTSFTIEQLFYTEETRYSENVFPFPLSELAGLIEEYDLEKTEVYLRRELSAFLNESIDNVVLGCTHYAIVKESFKKLFPAARIFDGAEDTCELIAKLLPALPYGDFDQEVDFLFTGENEEKKYEQILGIIQ